MRTVDAAGCRAPEPGLALPIGRDMNQPDDNARVQEQGQGADPIPEVFPGQDPKVDREGEKAKQDPMGGESPSS